MNKKTTMLLAISLLSASLTVSAELKLNYKPPQSGAPQTRIGSGTRGTVKITGDQLWVLAPNHTGLTSKAQPVLYWYLSSPTSSMVEVTVIREGVEEPLLEKQFSAAGMQGMQAISLANYGISLQEGVEYRWSVALINDSEQRSADQVVSATMRYQPTAQALTLEQLAEAGYWYDTVAQLADSHSPQLKEFLTQADLPTGTFQVK